MLRKNLSMRAHSNGIHASPLWTLIQTKQSRSEFKIITEVNQKVSNQERSEKETHARVAARCFSDHGGTN
jgi:hypothetical protein